MRDLKFRALTNSGIWEYGVMSLNDVPDEDNNYTHLGDMFSDYCNECYIAGTLTQFTGLTDKNGKEIYEGDVVRQFFSKEVKEGHKKYGLDWEKHEYPEFIDYLVVWDVDGMNKVVGFTMKSLAPFPFNESLWLLDLDKVEVVGDIHSNPELKELNKGE